MDIEPRDSAESAEGRSNFRLPAEKAKQRDLSG